MAQAPSFCGSSADSHTEQSTPDGTRSSLTGALEATGRGLPRNAVYWQLGEGWIAAERAARRPGW